MTDPNGNETRYTYDAQGNPIEITDTPDKSAEAANDEKSRPASATHPRGDVIAYICDEMGGVVPIAASMEQEEGSGAEQSAIHLVGTGGSSAVRLSAAQSKSSRATASASKRATDTAKVSRNEMILLANAQEWNIFAAQVQYVRIQEKGVASPRQNSKIAYSCGATGTTTDKENVNDGAAGVGYSTFGDGRGEIGMCRVATHQRPNRFKKTAILQRQMLHIQGMIH